MRKLLSPLVAGLSVAAALSGPASAQARNEIVVGYIMSATGSNASLGIHYRNALQLFPTEIGGVKVRYVARDDGSDSTQALNIARQMVVEEKVDVLIGPSLTTSALATLQFANDAKVPQIATAPFALDPKRYPWSFSMVQTGALMMSGVADQLIAKGVKKVGFIGFSDSFGDQMLDGLKGPLTAAGITITSDQRYARSDTSVQAQILRIMATRPDAIVVGASGTQGALPGLTLRERNFTGPVYNTHGAVNQDFLRVGGAAVEGEIAPTGPVSVFEQLPESNPSKAVSTAFMTKYMATFGEASRNAFAGYAYDGYLVFEAAAKTALGKARPGTQEFKDAFREAVETDAPIAGTHGMIKMSPTDHYGRDKTGLVMVQVEKGSWKLLRQ